MFEFSLDKGAVVRRLQAISNSGGPSPILMGCPWCLDSNPVKPDPMVSDFFIEQEMSFEQVKGLVRGMMAVARVDGVHDNEMALIRQFYESCTRKGDPRLEEVVAGDFDPAEVKTLFGSPELARMFVKTLILLAFADGTCAKVEDELIRQYAGTLGVSGPVVDQLYEATREYLLGGLAHIQNVEALKDVRRKLDPAGN